jgi:hypothetical protein
MTTVCVFPDMFSTLHYHEIISLSQKMADDGRAVPDFDDNTDYYAVAYLNATRLHVYDNHNHTNSSTAPTVITFSICYY